MPRRGENIYKRKDNRWEGRYIKGRLPSGKAQFGYVYAKTYQEVKRKLIEQQALYCQQPELVQKQHVSFSVYCDQWILLNRDRVKESTWIKYRNIVNNHIKPHIGQYTVQKLDAVVLESFSHTLLVSGARNKEGGLSAKTVKDILVVVHSILKYVQRNTGKQCPSFQMIYPKQYKKQMRVLSKEEQERLIAYLLQEMDACKFGVLLTLLTGMRIGEVCALRWQDISIDEKTIHVCNTMQRLQKIETRWTSQKTRVLITEPKTESSNRMIPLTDYAVALCKQCYCENQSAFVLTGTEQFMEPPTLQYRLHKYTADCGLSEVHFHVLRHTFATRCVEVGFEVKSLSEILGHSSVQVTLDRYVHSSLDLKRKNMNKLAAIGF